MKITTQAAVRANGSSCLRLFLLVLVILYLFKTSIGRTQDIPQKLSALITEALQNNQEIRGFEEKVQALKAEAPAAGSLPDPMVGIALTNVPTDSFELDQEAMTQKQLFISQKFPWFGTLALTEQIASLKAFEQESMLEVRKLAIARQVSETWYDLLFLEQNFEENKRLVAIVKQILRVTETRYSTGAGLQQDILAAQVQLSELIEEDVTLNSKQRALFDRLGALLNRTNIYSQGKTELPVPEEIIVSKDALSAQALRSAPLLEAQRAVIDRAKLEVDLAEKDYMPNIDVRLSYGQREDNPVNGTGRADLLSIGATFSVPLWQNIKQDNKLAAAKRRLSSAEKGLIGLELSLPHKIDGLLAEIASARENHQLFAKALSFQASQLADSSLAAYSVGKVEFNSMLSARIRLERVELKSEKYKYEAYKKLAELEEIVGSPLTFAGEK
ncbi:MAG: TolC family protein [Proteobacteria bacterium]|nr:TolC family protein [Pseudomonadota bacterium]